MKYSETLGIDVSKRTLDAYLHQGNNHFQFSNDEKGFRSMLKWLRTNCELPQCLICFEFTGDYSVPLSRFLTKEKLAFTMIPGLEIKLSTGLKRGKDDVIDAKRIAEYCWLRRDSLQPSKILSTELFKLQKLLNVRDYCVQQEVSLGQQKQEFLAVFKKSENPEMIKMLDGLLRKCLKTKSEVETHINELIRGNDELNRLYALMTSVVGIGPVIAWNMLVMTNGFDRFKSSRQFACFAGVAPFPHRSGTSLNSKDRVSHMANKHMKSLLNLGARSAIQADPELKAYYHRKIEEGKNKMNVLNAVRNKLIHRVFSVVNRGTPYVRLNAISINVK
jgi:transposase